MTLECYQCMRAWHIKMHSMIPVHYLTENSNDDKILLSISISSLIPCAGVTLLCAE